ncbi:signal peptide peptidase SppA [Persephonella sp.]|uniref:signal peptide peptidase SppA n=1 Tax=Persephonella sp. TaxID=2060922 RepID=UPI0025FDCE1C|nr:signal peptide peptidase SppA [Persephonella sp.]
MKKKIAVGIIVFLVILFLFSQFLAKSAPKIAMVEIKGVISEYMSVIDNIQRAQNDPSIKAVVLVVDSPGGSVGAAQEIYSAVEKLRKHKPVVVSMGNVAASGGYYVSLPANVIYANPGTITGSIGVIIQHVNVSKVLEKLGVKVENIKSGKNKDILFPNNKLTPEQKKLIMETIQDVYDQFLEDVVKYRPINMETLKKYADGRILTGRQAKKIKLVDKLGNIQDAVNEAKALAGLEGKKVLIIRLRKEEGFLKKLVGSKVEITDFIPYSQLFYMMPF